MLNKLLALKALNLLSLSVFIWISFFTGCKKKTTPQVQETIACDGEWVGSLEWIKNDYTKALKCAQQNNQFLLIDFWAEWCHTCLSMKNYTLKDSRFDEFKKKFVFLAVDTENPKNKKVLEKYPVQLWPTFSIIDSKTEKVQLQQLGGTTVEEFISFLSDGLSLQKGQLSVVQKNLMLVKQHIRNKDFSDANKLLSINLADKNLSLERKFENFVLQAQTLKVVDNNKCISELANEKIVKPIHDHPGMFTLDFDYYIYECFKKKLGKGTIEQLSPKELQNLNTIENTLGLFIQNKNLLNIFTLDDYVSGIQLHSEFLGLSDKAHPQIQKNHLQIIDLIKNEVAKINNTKNYQAGMIYSYPLIRSAKALGNGYLRTSLPILKSIQANNPNHYDPHYRVAYVQKELQDYQSALTNLTQAEKYLTGNRLHRVWGLQADIYQALNEKEFEIKKRTQLIHFYEEMGSKRYDVLLESNKKRLQEIKPQ